MNPVALIVLAALLIPLAGLFAAADAALNSVSRARVDTLVREGRTGAARAGRRGRRPAPARQPAPAAAPGRRDRGDGAAHRRPRPADPAGLGGRAHRRGRSWSWSATCSSASGPRTLGRQHPYELGVAIAAPLRALATLLGPLTKLLILIGNALTPGKGFRQGPFSSEVELRELVDMASTSGVVDETERKMIHSVFELGDTLVREVMVPRPDVVWVERDTAVEKVLRLALRSGYSRLPVLGENIDDIVGVAYLKDLVRGPERADRADEPDARLLTDVMRPAVFVPDSKRIDELLKEMQRTRNHMAIVVDEYGGTAGVVTIEDILEEIVGEITDEYDAEEVPDVARLDDGRLRVAARLPVEDLEQLFPDDYADYEADEGVGAALRAVLEDADVDTVGGLLAHQLGRVPLPGSEVEVAGLHLRAEGGKDARGRVRITTVLVTPPPDETHRPPPPNAGEMERTGRRVRQMHRTPRSLHPAPHPSASDGPDDPTGGRSADGTRRDGAGVPAGRREETDVRPG